MSEPSSAFEVKWASLLKVWFVISRKKYSNYFISTKVHSSFYCYRYFMILHQYLPSLSFHSFTHTKLSSVPSILQDGHKCSYNHCFVHISEQGHRSFLFLKWTKYFFSRNQLLIVMDILYFHGLGQALQENWKRGCKDCKTYHRRKMYISKTQKTWTHFILELQTQIICHHIPEDCNLQNSFTFNCCWYSPLNQYSFNTFTAKPITWGVQVYCVPMLILSSDWLLPLFI